MRNAYKIWLENLKGKYYLEGKCKEGNNVKIDHKVIGWDVVQDSFGFG
jgi:hypothetical protein